MIRVLNVASEFGDVVPTYFQTCKMCSGTEAQAAVALIEYGVGQDRSVCNQVPVCGGCAAQLTYGLVRAVGGVSVV